MKKLILFLTICLLLIPSISLSIEFHNANKVTLTWDEVTTDIDGDQITGVFYRLYLINANADPCRTDYILMIETTNTQETIMLTKGIYYVGIQAYIEDMMSIINWGDEPEGQEDVKLFGLRFAVPPKLPHSLNILPR